MKNLKARMIALAAKHGFNNCTVTATDDNDGLQMSWSIITSTTQNIFTRGLSRHERNRMREQFNLGHCIDLLLADAEKTICSLK